VVILHKEAIYILALEPAVTPEADAIDLEQPLVTPPPHRIDMRVKETGNVAGFQHDLLLVMTCHIHPPY